MLAAIETTGDSCGVAVFDGDRLVVEFHVELPRAHDRLLAWMFSEALQSANVRAAELESIAVSIGPGSYTGIRIGLSFAAGVALATGASIIPVPTLDAIAFNVRDLGRVGHRTRCISLVPAGRLGIYAGLYEIRPEFRRLTETKLIEVDQIPPLLDENVFAAGPGAALVHDSCFDCIAVDSEILTARAIGRRAIVLGRQGVSCRPEDVEPLYISGITSLERA